MSGFMFGYNRRWPPFFEAVLMITSLSLRRLVVLAQGRDLFRDHGDRDVADRPEGRTIAGVHLAHPRPAVQQAVEVEVGPNMQTMTSAMSLSRPS